MTVVWSDESLEDMERITVFPQAGRSCAAYSPRDVRDLVVGDYQLRYEVDGKTVRVVRVWHCKEDR